MYYLIKGILHDSEDPEIIEGTFEWAVENKEEALANIRDYEEVTEVVESTLEECIAHEEKITRSYCTERLSAAPLYGFGRRISRQAKGIK